MKSYYFILISILLFVNIDGIKASGIDHPYRLIAHRGGVTESDLFPENSIASLDEAIKRGYTGVEIDVRQSKDGKLFLYHDRTFERYYDSKARGEDLTWAEIQALRPLKEGVEKPISIEEYCRYCKGKVEELMIDIKQPDPSQSFYEELERILTETGFLKSSYFIGHGNYFKGKASITMLIREKEEFFKEHGEATKDYYFLFAGIDEINSRLIQWCNQYGIKLIACVNRPYREPLSKDYIANAGRDIKWLKECGVVNFQIDSDFDVFFR